MFVRLNGRSSMTQGMKHWAELLDRQDIGTPAQRFLQPRLVETPLWSVDRVEFDYVAPVPGGVCQISGNLDD
jgi:hypothetical protein